MLDVTAHLRSSVLTLSVLALVVGCGGESDAPPMGGADAGPTDTGRPIGPDRDQDEWTDSLDNCPDSANVEQRDRDRDGVGDACDTCPSTPNGGIDGQVGQDACAIGDELEPNNDAANAQAISLMPAGQVVAVRGTIESPRETRQSVDRYTLMVGGQTLLAVRVARASPDSLLEPSIEVTGGSYQSSRATDGLHIAARQFYFSEAGTYELVVADRRGRFGDEPKGSIEYTYELSIEALQAEPARLTPPFAERAIALERGIVQIFEAGLQSSDRARLQVDTPLFGSDGAYFGTGVDPILVLERADGTVWAENRIFADGLLDARILQAIEVDETVRVIIDQHRVVGDEELSVGLTIDYPPTDAELEPNNNDALASPLMFCPGCVTSGVIGESRGRQADIDWFVFEATAGQLMRFNGLVAQASQVDPLMAVGTFDDDGDFTPMYINGDSSGISARIDAIFPEAGTYYLGVVDELNLERDAPPYRGGPLLTYNILTEALFVLPAAELTDTSTQTDAINPGGKLNRYLASVTGPTRLRVDVQVTGNPDLEPGIRVYGPGVVGLLADDTDSVTVDLPAAGTYVIGVHNTNVGMGGPDFTYRLTATFQ